MPNAFANLALYAWPVVTVLLFLAFRPQVAVLCSIIGSMMYLPEKVFIDLPFHDFGKMEVASAAVLCGCLLSPHARRRLWTQKPIKTSDIPWFLYMAFAFATTKTNPEGLRYSDTVIPGLDAYEGLSMVIGDAIMLWIPFWIGRSLFHTRADAKLLLRAFQMAAVIYLPLIVIELVMSPQLHNWIYGFAQHDFIQTMRSGGYRPMAFMGHGLALTLFLSASIIAGLTLTMSQSAGPWRIRGRWISGLLLVVLVACKSTGALVFAMVFSVVLLAFKPAWQLRVFALLAAFVLIYPVTRATGLFPEKELIDAVVSAVGPERAQSLQFRFQNEHDLAERAAEKPWFGWGRFGRNAIYSIWNGQTMSVSDGQWIIVYGIRGVVGFLLFFIGLFVPVAMLRKPLTVLADVRDRALLTGLGCIVILYSVDLIPNGLFTNFPIFVAGALAGLAQGFLREAPPMTVSVQAQTDIVHPQGPS
jgi:hypothetical protein